MDADVLINPHFSGIGHYTRDLLYAVDGLLPEYKELDFYLIVHFRHLEKARSYGFKYIRILPSPFSLRVANALKIRNRQPPLDMIYGKGIYLFPNFTSWPLLFSKSIPFIYDISYELYPEFADPNNQKFLSTQVKKSLRRANAVITISQNSKDEVAEFYSIDPSKIEILYPAVDTSKFTRASVKDIARVKKEYAIDDDYILFVSNIEPRKNIKNLLLAYELLPQSIRTKHPLLLVGASGWQNNEIHTIIERLRKNGNKVMFPSKYVIDEDLSAIYTGASVFVYPSIYEGFGMPPLEAMACGTPVVCANNSSLPEAVGDAAITVDALSPQSIADGIVKVVTNPELQSTMVKKGKKQVKKYTWEDSAKKLLQTLKETQ